MVGVNLRGEAAVVTGGGRGLGRAVALHLAHRGASIALCSRTRSELDDTAAAIRAETGVDVIAEAVDVTDVDAVHELATRVRALHDPMRILVNCAGVLGPVGRIDTVDLEEWHHALDVNLFGVVTACATFAPVLAESGGGSIVNLSGGGLGGPGIQSHISAYTGAKAAVAVLTETLARELAPLGIRVNAVAPGAVPTDLMRPVLDAGPERAGEALYETARRIYEEPSDNAVLGDDFAALLDFLVSGESTAITGRLLSARWESPDRLHSDAEMIRSGSRYTLRRIDEALFREAEPGSTP